MISIIKHKIRFTLLLMQYNVLAIAFLLLAINYANGQNSYFDQDPIWTVHSGNMFPYPCLWDDTYNYYVDGDTVIDSHRYKKLYAKGYGYHIWHNSPPIPLSCQATWSYNNDSVPVGYVRDTLNKIYINHFAFTSAQMFHLSSISNDTLLYDFNLSVGDTLPTTFIHAWGSLYVTSIDSVRIGNEYRKKFNLAGSGARFMIEGVGHELGFIENMGIGLSVAHNLQCYGLGDSAYFPTPGLTCELNVGINNIINSVLFSVYPNPAFKYLVFNMEGNQQRNQDLDLSMYSSTGKLVFSREYHTSQFTVPRNGLPGGLYFYRIVSEVGGISSGKVVFD